MSIEEEHEAKDLVLLFFFDAVFHHSWSFFFTLYFTSSIRISIYLQGSVVSFPSVSFMMDDLDDGRSRLMNGWLALKSEDWRPRSILKEVSRACKLEQRGVSFFSKLVVAAYCTCRAFTLALTPNTWHNLNTCQNCTYCSSLLVMEMSSLHRPIITRWRFDLSRSSWW